jgi:hypothetical protein
MQRSKPPPWVKQAPPSESHYTAPKGAFSSEWHTHVPAEAVDDHSAAGPIYHDPEEFARLCSELPFREAVETCTAALESAWLELEHIPEILVKASRPKLYTRGYLQDMEEEEEEEMDTNKLFPGMLHPAVATQTRNVSLTDRSID